MYDVKKNSCTTCQLPQEHAQPDLKMGENCQPLSAQSIIIIIMMMIMIMIMIIIIFSNDFV